MELIPVRRIVEEPTWFGPDERPLAGWVTYPADRRVDGGVVLCLPTGEETRLARRTFRDLAQALASAGWASLRFDYDGTGDSAGEVNDAARTGWTQSFAAAYRYVAGLGVPRVSAIGMRLGGTIAAAAAVEHDLPLESLVLWDPCDSGRSFLREQQMLRRAMPSPLAELEPGWVETAGYVFAPSAVAALRAVTLPSEPALLGSARVVSLVRDDRPVLPGVQQWLASVGASIEPCAGQAMLLNISVMDTIVPRTALDRVVELTTAAGAGRSTTRIPVPATRASARFRHQGAEIVETFRRIGPQRLCALESRPAANPAGPPVAFVNTVNDNHVGPARMWVDLGRAWAACGTFSVRVDFSGVGDSEPWPGRPRDLIHAPEWLDDTSDILDTLPTAVLVGLCSGAYAALEAALRHRVAGAIVINPIIDQGNMDPGTPTYDPRRLARREMSAPLRRLAVKHRRTALKLWDTFLGARPGRAPMSVVDTAVSRGTDLLLVVSEEDREPFLFSPYWRGIGRRRLHATGRFTEVATGPTDHSALDAIGRGRIMASASAHLDRLRAAACTYDLPAPERRETPRGALSVTA